MCWFNYAVDYDDHRRVGCRDHRPSTSPRRSLCSQLPPVRHMVHPATYVADSSPHPPFAAASLLAFLTLTNYVGIVTVVASSLSAFIEYTSAPQKLGRYNASVLALHVSLNWWASLSDIMKKDRKNVSRLMEDCERAYVSFSTCIAHILTWRMQDFN